ncbi:phosphate transporter PHO1 homolog 9-like isoform X2 [Cynara cardunculus var. scolymus]|uniref:phosphate transporter PHO1 homolog 9-like isoform X2 n=1 Tax=Cynara cardunculus var. scolymus TaxID=59895 RepID=UPI000D6306AA|nr:phosphate transporter PHO1 homolog 9-like isoform X2 [Cynara cardunculus var. scolymus]
MFIIPPESSPLNPHRTMKFGKEFASQMVPEWQAAYMNYNHLKILVKEISIFRRLQQNGSPPSSQANPPPPLQGSSMKKKVSLHRAFSGLTNSNPDNKDKEDEVILVSAMHQSSEENYQTIFLRSSEDGGEAELHFFRRLDDEFNKVINFYKAKVGEMVNEADELSKQMNALIALRMKLEDPAFCSSSPVFSSRLFDEEQIRGYLRQLYMHSKRRTGSDHRIDKEHEMVSLGVLNHVKINVASESPISSLKHAFSSSKSGVSFSKRELRDAERKLKQAFIEFHQKLRYLKSYSFLNRLAFSKIMKKYDKVTSRNASKAYLEMVEKSYLTQSNEVAKLVESVEAVFIEHFSNGNRSQGLKMLRLKAKTDKHRITFFMGCFVGCSLALVVAIVLITHARKLLKSDGRDQYMTNVFPLYSVFGYLVLHMLMYAGNVYYWKRFRINYSFIFGFKPNTELGFREILLISSALSVLALAAVLSNLEMDMDESIKSFRTVTELLPLGLVIVVLLIAVCPFNIVYRTNRFFLITCLWHCICAPLYKVTLPDFFLADQLTSQVQLLRNLQFYICYYGWGDYKKRESTRCQGALYNNVYLVIAIIPYWIRCAQCLRRLFEGEDSSQGVNALKYLSTVASVITRTFYAQKKGLTLKIMAASTSTVATVFNTYWDLVCDWGLIRRNSKNPWLRDRLLLPHRSIYFLAMVVNVILRLAWMQTVLDFHEGPFLHRTALTAMVASLEIIRRGVWNFFRLENEHLNNVGKYRAFKSVPLPFSYENHKDV